MTALTALSFLLRSSMMSLACSRSPRRMLTSPSICQETGGREAQQQGA